MMCAHARVKTTRRKCKSLNVNRGRFFLLSIRTQEFLLPDGVVPQMAMLNAARKARIQPYLDADGALEQAAVF